MGDDTRWKGLDHEAIHKMINAGPGPSASGPQAQFWGTLSAGLNEISTKLHEKLNSLKVAWDGQSSENAQAGMSPLKDWAGNAESGSNVMKTSFELQGNYVGDARAEVPEPVRVSTPQPSGWQMAGAAGALLTGNAGPAAAVAAQAADHEGQERAKDEAARQAVVAMTKYESSSDWNADTLGRFDTPPEVVVDTPPPAGNGNVNVVETRGINNNNTFQNNTTTTTTPTHTQSTPPPQVSTPPPIHTPPPPVGTPPPTPPQHIPTPIQHFPPTPTPPPPTPNPPFPPPTPPPGGNPGFPPGGGPFVPGYNNTGGGGGNSGGRGGNSSGQGGRGGPGGANAFGPNAVDSEGRQLGRGGPGGGNPMAHESMGRGGPGGGNMSGSGGRGTPGQTGAGGRRADGEDDDEHETPDYLLETEDVFGDERMVAPSVIGEKREQ